MHLGGEALVDHAVAHGHGGDQHLLAVVLLAALDVELFAQRQEFRVVLHPRHQREHLLGRMGNAVRGLVDMHDRGADARC